MAALVLAFIAGWAYLDARDDYQWPKRVRESYEKTGWTVVREDCDFIELPRLWQLIKAPVYRLSFCRLDDVHTTDDGRPVARALVVCHEKWKYTAESAFLLCFSSDGTQCATIDVDDSWKARTEAPPAYTPVRARSLEAAIFERVAERMAREPLSTGARGEPFCDLSPLRGDKEFTFVGTFDMQDAYVRASQTVQLEDSVLVADVFIVSEQSGLIVYDPTRKKAALVGSTEEAANLRSDDFVTPPADSPLSKAVDTYRTPLRPDERTVIGRSSHWRFIG